MSKEKVTIGICDDESFFVEQIKFCCESYLEEIFKEDRVFDISICMYNILLNAIEALEKLRTEEKNINVEIKEYQKKVYIKISNKCNICGDKEDIKELITDKKDVCNHGIGSKSIADIVKKNDGKVIYSVKNGWFITELLI